MKNTKGKVTINGIVTPSDSEDEGNNYQVEVHIEKCSLDDVAEVMIGGFFQSSIDTYNGKKYDIERDIEYLKNKVDEVANIFKKGILNKK